MSRSTIDYLRHMLDETSYLLREVSGKSKQALLADATLQRAAVRSLEIIGEAAKNVPADFRLQHPGIPWSDMAAMRDRLIHGYFGVDYDIVWDVVHNKVPALHRQLAELLKP
jgi:uncharacterized protein with HEPN domain